MSSPYYCVITIFSITSYYLRGSLLELPAHGITLSMIDCPWNYTLGYYIQSWDEQ